MKNEIKVTTLVFIIGIMIALVCYVTLMPKTTANGMNRFETIPEKPDDFDAYTREIWGGGLTDLCEISEEYWMQPEFYGSTWENAKQQFYTQPDYAMWGVYGQGNMPREISYTLTDFKEGDEFELCTFFHNGFGIWTYQGFKLISSKSEYFDVEITPNELTMSPTFPVFENGWTQKITIKIIAKKDIPEGNYNLILNPVSPSFDYSKEETKRVLQMTVDKEKYKEECYSFLNDIERCNWLINHREKKYVEGGAYQSSEPLLKLGITIK